MTAVGWRTSSRTSAPTARLGAIDAYTAFVGVFALLGLAAHGATYLVWKTTGATAASQPHYFAAFAARPWLWPVPAVAAIAGALVLAAHRRGRELAAFLASCTFLAALLAATATTLFPTILRSTVDPRFSLDAFNASSARATSGSRSSPPRSCSPPRTSRTSTDPSAAR